MQRPAAALAVVVVSFLVAGAVIAIALPQYQRQHRAPQGTQHTRAVATTGRPSPRRPGRARDRAGAPESSCFPCASATPAEQAPAPRAARRAHQPSGASSCFPCASAAPATRAARRPARGKAAPEAKGAPLLSPTAKKLLLWWAAWTAATPFIVGGSVTWLTIRRLRRRKTRDYGLYEVHLSMHDQAKPRDVEDMVEALGNAVREFPEERARDGQPFIAFEMHYGPADSGYEWTLAIRCERDLVSTIDGILAAAYPDVRLGHINGEAPQALRGTLPMPGSILRFRKDRPFVYALSTAEDEDASPPIEAIAQAQVALGKRSSVRIQLTPAPGPVEAYARRRYHRHENKLVRSESWGMTEAGLRDQLNRQEMASAKRTMNKALFWLEVQVAADTREDCNRVAASLAARRGDNRLHRRWMILRVNRYLKRFPEAVPPLFPTMSLRSLVSSAEVAHLVELPSARMKTVPVRRVTTPRLPAPPEVSRATADAPLAPPAPPTDVAPAAAPTGATAQLELPPAAA